MSGHNRMQINGHNQKPHRTRRPKKHTFGEVGSCGKRTYHTVESVEEALRYCNQSARYNSKRQEQRYYWCYRCNGYHATKEALRVHGN